MAYMQLGLSPVEEADALVALLNALTDKARAK